MALTRCIKKSYLAAIKNSVGSNTFRDFYAIFNEKELDVLRDGELSCAYFVSGILAMYELVSGLHMTVDGTMRAMKDSEWFEIDEPVPGAVLFWESQDFGGESHKHVGFYVGDGRAISNSYRERTPVEHDWKFDGKRKVTQIFWHKKLEE